jgi:hypothetical protein
MCRYGLFLKQSPAKKNFVLISVADPHRKNADADLGKNLNADADPDADTDPDSCPY